MKKSYKGSLPVFLCILCGVLTGCHDNWMEWQIQEPVPTFAEREISVEDIDETSEEESEEDCEEKEAFCFYYDLLSEGEQVWYLDILRILESMETDAELSKDEIEKGLTGEDVDRIFQSVLNDHPELFYVEGYRYTNYTKGGKLTAIEFSGTYSMDAEKAAQYSTQIEEQVSRILDEKPPCRDDYEKLKYAYEALILSTDYDEQAEENQNIYSVFVARKSVCQGYAKAYQYLCRRMGVDCTLVQGAVRESGDGHAWNLVRADGEYYYVDPTWGDVSYKERTQASLPEISYDYFGLTTEEILKTHKLSENFRMPACRATKDNYYVREDCLFEDYDREHLAELFRRMESDRETVLNIKCAGEDCYREMHKALVEDREIFSFVSGMALHSLGYTDNETQRTMSFYIVTSKE